MNDKRGGFIIPLLVIVLAAVIVGGAWFLWNNQGGYFPIHTLEATKGFVAAQDDRFTISPDGNLILYPTGHNIAETFTILDIRTGVTHELLRADTSKGSFDPLIDLFGDLDKEGRCWTQDSKLCIIPAQNSANGYATKGPAFVVDVSDPTNPKLVKQDIYTENAAILIKYSNLNPSGKYFCSDCEAGKPDPNILPHSGTGTYVEEASMSPDGKYASYQISYGQGFISPPDLHIIDVATKKDILVAKNVYYTTRWAPDSHRLYFYMCKTGGACNEDDFYLRYIEL